MYQEDLKSSSILTQFNLQLSDLVKRTFDVFASTIVMILFVPFFGLIAYAVKRESPGPVFYRGSRIGRYGKHFKIIKFRTMYETPESYAGPKVTAQDDPRVTPLGHWLRVTKLNELPQFWNVLIGEMSLVGPRPEDPELAKTWPREVWKEVLSVSPGITSPASVQYRDEENLLSSSKVMQKYLQELSPDKARMDQLYVRYRSFWLDLDILFWTALIMMPVIRSYTPPEEFLFVGPVTRLIHRHVSWFTIDLLVTFLAITFTGLLFRASSPLDIGWPRAIAMAIGFALLFSITGAIMGVNRINWTKASNSEVFDLLPAWIIATIIAFFVNYFLGIFSSGLILIASFLALSGFVLVRYRNRFFWGLMSRIMHYQKVAQATSEHVLIIGTGSTAQMATWLIKHNESSSRFWVVGFIDNDFFKQGMRIYGSEVIGTCKDVPDLITKHDVGVVIVADESISNSECEGIKNEINPESTRFAVVPDIIGTFESLIATPQSDPIIK
jgi:lipopolysaccharide/colanic/teichoic acid biosynthesis glycosyltransferase